MLYNATNGSIQTSTGDMHYISFGNGKQPLIMLPGLGEGLRTVKGTAPLFAAMYHMYAKDYKVYVFSRRDHLQAGCTTKDMAADQAFAMQALGIENAYVMGISMGGMIAQHLAADYPHLVSKLALVVTLAKQNEYLQSTVSSWVEMAHQGDYAGILKDTAKNSYSQSYYDKYRFLLPFTSLAGKPKSFTRFFTQADACASHDAYNELYKITCPTIVIGGGHDKVVGPDAALEIAQRIKGSKLLIYKKLGHGLYEEAKDFNAQIINFFN